nr:hypothetical protein [Sphingomonas sp. ZFBP2030]
MIEGVFEQFRLRATLRNILNQGGELPVFADVGGTERKLDRKDVAVAALGRDLDLGADQSRRTALHEARKPAFMRRTQIVRHDQLRHAMPDRFFGAPSESQFGVPVPSTDNAVLVDRHDRLMGGCQNALEALLVGSYCFFEMTAFGHVVGKRLSAEIGGRLFSYAPPGDFPAQVAGASDKHDPCGKTDAKQDDDRTVHWPGIISFYEGR